MNNSFERNNYAPREMYFINPYNFVPQSENSVKRSAYKKGNLSGYITCTLTAKDRIILPDREKKVEDSTYDFFNINGKPVIPGSEIRGVIRSVFETVTYSCFSVINDNNLSGRITPQNTVPGILERENGKWLIYEARTDTRHGDIKREWTTLRDKKSLKTSYFTKTGARPVYCGKEDIERFKRTLETYKENSFGDKKRVIDRTLKTVKNMEKGGKGSIALFFKPDLSYISPAQIGRNAFKNTVTSLLEDYAPCAGKDSLYCPACSLFGTLGNNNPVASRVRFGDAFAKNYQISDKYIQIPELASPKITSVEFYTLNDKKFNEKKLWNYDTAGTVLRGRKYYFHSPSKENHGTFVPKRHLKTKAVLKGSCFEFKVYFDKISESELKKLVWALSLGENSADSTLLHKIGSGKPVGYGSVKILAGEVVLRNADKGYLIVRRDANDYLSSAAELGLDPKAVNALLKIADYNYVKGLNVSYPLYDDGRNKTNSKAAHGWFKENKSKAHHFEKTLPELTDNPKDLCLPAHYSSAKKQNNYYKKR